MWDVILFLYWSEKITRLSNHIFFFGGGGGGIFFSSTIIDEGLVESLFFLEYIIFFIPCHKTFELFLLCSKKIDRGLSTNLRKSINLLQHIL